MGSSPDRDTYDLEQNTFTMIVSLHPVPSMVGVDIVYEKTFGGPWQPRAVSSPGS